MELKVDETILEAGRSVRQVVREHAEEGERNRRPSKQVIDALRQAGLFRLLTPRSLGGSEADPITVASVIEEVASYDSAAGWALMTGNSVDWWCSRLPDDGAEELYAESADVIIAAAFHPPVQARATDGGYVFRGRAPLASNIEDANWLLLNGLVMEGEAPKLVDGNPQVVSGIVRAGEAEVIDTWHTLGMRGTNSNDVAVDDVFVPARRTFPLAPTFQPGSHYRGTLYGLPAIGEVAVVGSPLLLAMARGAIDELKAIAVGKTPFGSSGLLKERALVQAKVARAEAVLRSARLLYYETLAEAWRMTVAGEAISLDGKGDLMLAVAHVTAAAVEVAELMYGLAGTTAIYERSRLERLFRDIQTLRHHGFVSENRYETAGQVLLGVAPEFVLVTF